MWHDKNTQVIISTFKWDTFPISNFEDMNQLIFFFDFLPCCEKVPENKEFIRGNSKITNQDPLRRTLYKQNCYTQIKWDNFYLVHMKLFLFLQLII